MTIQDIADRLSLSRSTVSRALRGDARISSTTKERVEQTARDIGYKANPYLSVLMHNLRIGAPPSVNPVIAFINPHPSRETWYTKKTNQYIHSGAKKRASEIGFTLEEFWLGEQRMTPRRLREILQARNIRALILASDELGNSETFPTDGFAAVGLERNARELGLHCVSADYLGNTQLALEALRGQGYRKIGLALNSREASRTQMHPRMAFLDYEEGLPECERAGYWIGDQDDFSSFAKWLKASQPDALVTSDWLPQKWLQPLGLMIPQDIGVAQLEPLFFPFSNSGIDGHLEQIGSAAVDLLISQIHANEFSPPELARTTRSVGIWRKGSSSREVFGETPGVAYTDSHLELLEIASHEPNDRVAAVRRRVSEMKQAAHFPRAKNRPSRDWETLDLQPAANASFEQPVWDPLFPKPLPLPEFSGLHIVRGVPFQRPESGANGRLSAILIQPRSDRPNLVASLNVAQERNVEAVYFAHISFYGWNGSPISGEYRLVYESGAEESIPLQFYNPLERKIESATHQDSWPAHAHFECEPCKYFLLASETRPFEDDRFGYVLERAITDSSQRLSRIEFYADEHSNAQMLVAGITLLLRSDQ